MRRRRRKGKRREGRKGAYKGRWMMVATGGHASANLPFSFPLWPSFVKEKMEELFETTHYINLLHAAPTTMWKQCKGHEKKHLQPDRSPIIMLLVLEWEVEKNHGSRQLDMIRHHFPLKMTSSKAQRRGLTVKDGRHEGEDEKRVLCGSELLMAVSVIWIRDCRE